MFREARRGSAVPPCCPHNSQRFAVPSRNRRNLIAAARVLPTAATRGCVMDGSMDHFSRILPEQLPIGASYVVEGYGGETGHLRVTSRYVLLPDGRRSKVPADFALPAARRRAARGRNRWQRKAKSRPLATGKKILAERGT